MASSDRIGAAVDSRAPPGDENGMRELLVLTLALLTVGCTAAVPTPPPAAPPVTELPLPTPRPEGPPKPLRTPVPRPEHAEPEPFRLEQPGGGSEIGGGGKIGKENGQTP